MEDEQLLLRQMPHSVEAEQAVLGSMLIDARCVPEVIDQLRSDDFYVRQNREIYETIYSMFNYSLTIDPVTAVSYTHLHSHSTPFTRNSVISDTTICKGAAVFQRPRDVYKRQSLYCTMICTKKRGFFVYGKII